METTFKETELANIRKSFAWCLGKEKKVYHTTIGKVTIDSMREDALMCFNGSETLHRLNYADCRIIVDSVVECDQEGLLIDLCLLYDLQAGRYIPVLLSKEEDSPNSDKIKGYDRSIRNMICKISGISYQDLFYGRTKYRKREFVNARQVYMVVRHTCFKDTLAKSASNFGLDHATCLNAFKTINQLLETNRAFQMEYFDVFDFCIKKFGRKLVESKIVIPW